MSRTKKIKLDESKTETTKQETEVKIFEFICDYISTEDDDKLIIKFLENSIPRDFHVNYSNLTDVILSDVDLALVMRLPLSDDDPNDLDTDQTTLYSLTTVIGLEKHKNETSIIQLKQALIRYLSKIDNGSDLINIFTDSNNNIGLIINERLVEHASMTTKVLETIFDDIRSFAVDDESLRYSHYCVVLACSRPSEDDETEFYYGEMKAVFEEFPMRSMIKIESEVSDRESTVKSQGYRAIVVFRSDEIDRFLSCVKCNLK